MGNDTALGKEHGIPRFPTRDVPRMPAEHCWKMTLICLEVLNSLGWGVCHGHARARGRKKMVAVEFGRVEDDVII